MNIQVLFFGATADITGHRRLVMEVPVGSKTTDIFESLVKSHPELRLHKLHISLNQQYASDDDMIRDGDEIGIFTAVSGG